MSRALNKLHPKKVEHYKKPGLYGDGGGLYLQITVAGVKSWLFRYMRNGKARGMGLGPIHVITLAEAREKAHICRRQLHDGLDPLEVKHAKGSNPDQAATTAKMTFKQCAGKYIETHKAGWKNEKHADQWTNTLATYAYPLVGELSVDMIGLPVILEILEPIWSTKTETASRLRGRLEAVLDWATVTGLRSGDNPARWKGHLDKLLPKRSRVQQVRHHPALPYRDVSMFMVNLIAQEGIARFALELLILTATRTSEVLNAAWSEFDLSSGVWVIPAARMKAGREHNVPLSGRAIAIVRHMESIAHNSFVFPGMRAHTPLSNMAMLQLLKRMKRGDLTAHGFRSTFRDWAGECTNHPREVCEAALAHLVKDKVEAAYARGDLFAKRRALMADWAAFCSASACDNLSVLNP